MRAPFALAGLLLLAAACSGDRTDCRNVSRNAAIKLALNAKSQNVREQDRSIWASDAIKRVELTNINDAAAIVAKVLFEGDGRSAPMAFIYGDCVVEWTVQDAER